MQQGSNEYRIGELAEATGVTRRTIHYYVGRGLLPAPRGAGLGTVYSDEHILRIQLIKRMQEVFLPLEEIRRRITNMNLGDVQRALVDEVLQNEPPLAVEESRLPYGTRYERVSLGADVELHYPSDGSARTREMVARILTYVESLSKEV